VRLDGRTPETAADVLEVQALAITPMVLAESLSTPPPSTSVHALLEWCARHTTEVTIDGAAVDDIACALDESLVPVEQIAWAQRLIAAASLHESIERSAAEYLDILADGGCECAWCAPRKGRARPDTRPAACLLRPIPEPVRSLVVSWWPLRSSVSPSNPYWSHQLAAHWAASVGRVQAEARRKSELRDHARGRLHQMGIL
jgi:hypothetical protein